MYADDLAYIHDQGFSHHARGTAAGVLATLQRAGVSTGLVVDLGCGGGITARALLQAGYEVLGIDQSAGLLRQARRRAPGAAFERGSFFDFEIPPCAAVVSMGECLGYRPEKRGGTGPMIAVMRRAARALTPGGMLVFDLVTNAVAREALFFRQGNDWALASHNTRNSSATWLTRDITTFRKVGQHFRRGHEVHHVQLYRPADLAARVRKLGFTVRTSKRLGTYDLAPGRSLFVARKQRGHVRRTARRSAEQRS